MDSAIQGVFDPRAVVGEIHDRNIFCRHVHEFEYERHRALRYRPAPDDEHSSVKLHERSIQIKKD
jgi:hypothetical protein